MSKILIENLKALRDANKLSQGDVAVLLKVSTAQYNKIENINTATYPSPENLIALGDLYNISIDELLGREFSADGKSTLKKLRVKLEIDKEVDGIFDEIFKKKKDEIIKEIMSKLNIV